MRTLLSIILIIPLISFSQSKREGTLFETTIQDTNVVKNWINIDTLRGNEDFDLNEENYFIHWNYKRKYETVIVYFDSLKTDTFMLSIYNGYKDYLFKKWFLNGKLQTIENSKKGINKSWYKNGNLRWDKVPNSGIFAFNYSVDLKNKSWFSNGSIRSEFIEIDSNKVQFLIYYNTGKIRYKCNYYIPEEMTKGDGYSYPAEYKYPKMYREEFYCENGQILHYNEPFVLIKDYKTFYCNGNIKTRNDFYKPFYSPYGKFETYFPNGKLEKTGEFEEYDENNCIQAARIGTWIYYNEAGEIIKTEEFDTNGNLIEKN